MGRAQNRKTRDFLATRGGGEWVGGWGGGQLPTCLRRLAAGFCAAWLRSRDPLAGLKHHGSEGRSGPAAGSPYCQTLLLNCLESSFKPCFYLPSCSANCQLACVVLQLAFVLHSSGQGTPSQGSNTMAVKDGAGPRPAAQSAKRCFLNCLETIFKPCFYLPSCSANCQLACVVFCSWLLCCSSGQGTPSQAQTPCRSQRRFRSPGATA